MAIRPVFRATADLDYHYWGKFFHLAVFEEGDDPREACETKAADVIGLCLEPAPARVVRGPHMADRLMLYNCRVRSALSTWRFSLSAALREIRQSGWRKSRTPTIAPNRFRGKDIGICAAVPAARPMLNTGHMHLSARLRSSTALVVVGLLVGISTLPLALCAFEGRHARCAAQVSQPPASHDGCHQSQAPAASLSCCCTNATDPTSPPATTIITESSLSLIVSTVVPVAPAIQGLNYVCESATLPLHARPLFTLHSVFRI